MVFTDSRTLVLNLTPARPAISIDWVVANEDVTGKSHELMEAVKNNARGEVLSTPVNKIEFTGMYVCVCVCVCVCECLSLYGRVCVCVCVSVCGREREGGSP